MKNVFIFERVLLTKDIKRKRIKLTNEKDMYLKFKGYIDSCFYNNFEYDCLCLAFKCKYLLEKNFPNSEYILKVYKHIKICENMYQIKKRKCI